MDRWIQILVSVLSGIAVLIPMIWELVKYVKVATKERNWPKMLELIMSLMADAEKELTLGSEKKEWVLGQLNAMASTLNYDIDWDVVSKMIDDLCSLSKEIN